MTIKQTSTGREGISWTDAEIESHRQEKIEQVRKDEEKDKLEAWKEYIEENINEDERLSISLEFNAKESIIYTAFEAEYEQDKTHLRDLEPADSHSQYYAPGKIELVMDMAEKLMNDPVVFNNPEYYREAHKAHTALFNLSQLVGLVGLDWFDMI